LNCFEDIIEGSILAHFSLDKAKIGQTGDYVAEIFGARAVVNDVKNPGLWLKDVSKFSPF